MVSVSAGDVDAEKFVSPPYCAVMVCVPRLSELVDQDAEPASTEAVPKAVPPSRKVTVPVGVPMLDCGATFVVNATVVPCRALNPLVASVVVVAITCGPVPLVDPVAVPPPEWPPPPQPSSCAAATASTTPSTRLK